MLCCAVPCRAMLCGAVPYHSGACACAWRGVAWHGMALRGMAWHGMAWHGVAWCGVTWNGVRCVARVPLEWRREKLPFVRPSSLRPFRRSASSTCIDGTCMLHTCCTYAVSMLYVYCPFVAYYVACMLDVSSIAACCMHSACILYALLHGILHTCCTYIAHMLHVCCMSARAA